MENKNDLVNVVMATYHGDSAHNLQQAVDSILKQTHSNFELILTIDGPVPEERAALLKEIESSDNRILLLWNTVNKGPGAARNAAIKIAKGKYIAIFDSDDIAFPDKLENQLSYLQKECLDLVGSFYIEFDNDIQSGKEIRPLPIDNSAIKNAIAFYNPIANPTVFAKAEVFKQFGYYEKYRFGEDYALWIKLLKNGINMGNCPFPTIYFRRGSAFINRRRGIKIAKTDFLNKLSSSSLYPFYLKPKIWLLAIATFLARLLPSGLFNYIRNLRHKKNMNQ